jgi:hypothetical protein
MGLPMLVTKVEKLMGLPMLVIYYPKTFLSFYFFISYVKTGDDDTENVKVWSQFPQQRRIY